MASHLLLDPLDQMQIVDLQYTEEGWCHQQKVIRTVLTNQLWSLGEIWSFFCEQTKGCGSSGSSWFHQLPFFGTVLIQVSDCAFKWSGLGRMQGWKKTAPGSFQSQYLTGSASSGCMGQAGVPDAVRLRNTHAFSVTWGYLKGFLYITVALRVW